MVAYTNDLRLAELATGEGSGTWGNTSNTNLELISEAFSFGTEAITTNADTHTTTIADGSTDPGRSLFLKYTGTLDSTCTITIGPNTVSKLWFIENATSGSQSIIIKQGSGATVTIANGQTKAIYSDGAGAGAAMVDAFTDLSVTGIDVTGTVTADDAEIGGTIPASPDGVLAVRSDSDAHAISIYEPAGANENWQIGVDADGDLGFYNSGSTTAAVTIDDANNVGIGTTSPNDLLHIKSTSADAEITLESTSSGGDARLRMIANSSGLSSIQFQDEGDSNIGFVNYDHSDNSMHFRTNDAERMRIDSSGNLLVGTTDTDPQSSSSNSGVQMGDGFIFAARAGEVAIFNRQSTDGDIAVFRKDGSTVGSLGIESAGFYIDGESAHAGLSFAGFAIVPRDNGARVDNAVDLGSSAHKFRVVYAGTGTINTSDRNEKQDIELLSDAEQRVAVAAKSLLRKFRFIDAVEAKGDEARIHFGIIAQDLQDAFTAEGLDASRYAMWCSDTWTDEDGNEQTRLGVRYSELLAFIIAAI